MSLRVVLALGIALLCVQTTLGQRWPVPYGSVDTLTDHSSNPEKDGFKHVRHSIGFDFILKDDTSGKCPPGFHVDKNYFNGDTVQLQQFRDSFKQSQMPSIVWFGEEYHNKNGKRMRSFYTLSPHPCHLIPGFSEVGYPLRTPCHVKLTMACARPTGTIGEYKTTSGGGLIVLRHIDGGKPHKYMDARKKCQQSVGFDLPTFAELTQMKESNGFWSQPYRDVVLAGLSWQSWTLFKHNDLGIGMKRFICVGCRPEFMRSYGIESITPDGVVTCIGGFINVKTSSHSPKCSNGQWQHLDACERYLTFHYGGRDLTPSQSVYNRVDIYNSAFHYYANAVKHHRPTYRTDLEKETALRRFVRKYGKLNGFGTFGTKLTVGDKPNQHHHYQKSIPERGLFTCAPGYVWRCPRKEQDCSRSGHTYIPVIRSERNVHRYSWQSYSYTNYWLNTPYCTKTVVNFPPSYPKERVFLSKETATFKCHPHYYEVCSSGTCAGGIGDVPARYEMQPDGTAVWSNLPNCEPFELKSCSYGKVSFHGHFADATTFEKAEYACQKIGYVLTPAELFSYSSPLGCRGYDWRRRANWQGDGTKFNKGSQSNGFMCIPHYYKGFSDNKYQYSKFGCEGKDYYHLWRPQNGEGRNFAQAAAACGDLGLVLPRLHAKNNGKCVMRLLAYNVNWKKISNKHDFAWMNDILYQNQYGQAFYALNYKHLSAYYSNKQLRTTYCVQR